MAEKVFKTYRQLIRILRDRGVCIAKGSAGSRAMRILETENYYNIVNGYKDFFLQTRATSTVKELYKAGTTFDEMYALYCFDRNVRNIYLKCLLKAENKFKTIVSHEFSEVYGYDNYMKLKNFQCSASVNRNQLFYVARKHRLDLHNPDDLSKANKLCAEENIGSITELIGDIQKEISRQMSKHHSVVTHYMTEHGYIPLWVLVNVLTFGKITKFYYNMKDVDQVTVARIFGMNFMDLHKNMTNLGIARNLCAHDERFFDIRVRKAIRPNGIRNFSVLGIPRNSSNYLYGTKDAYAIAIVFALILSKNDINEFIANMKVEFSKLDKKLHTISVQDIMLCMGYGPTWTNLIKLK